MTAMANPATTITAAARRKEAGEPDVMSVWMVEARVTWFYSLPGGFGNPRSGICFSQPAAIGCNEVKDCRPAAVLVL